MVKQCVSPDLENFRCPDKAIGNSLFCATHSKHFKPIYLKYKKLERSLNKIVSGRQINVNMSFPNLWKIHQRLWDAYQMRVNYRKQAFVQEAWDRGHDMRIQFICQQLIKCKNILAEKHHELEEINESDDESSDESSDDESSDDGYYDTTPPSYREISRRIYKSQDIIRKTEKGWSEYISDLIEKEQKKLAEGFALSHSYDRKAQELMGLTYRKYFMYFHERIQQFAKTHLQRAYSIYPIITKVHTINTTDDNYPYNKGNALCQNCLKLQKDFCVGLSDISKRLYVRMHDIFSKLPDIQKFRVRYYRYNKYVYRMVFLDIPGNNNFLYLISNNYKNVIRNQSKIRIIDEEYMDEHNFYCCLTEDGTLCECQMGLYYDSMEKIDELMTPEQGLFYKTSKKYDNSWIIMREKKQTIGVFPLDRDSSNFSKLIPFEENSRFGRII